MAVQAIGNGDSTTAYQNGLFGSTFTVDHPLAPWLRASLDTTVADGGSTDKYSHGYLSPQTECVFLPTLEARHRGLRQFTGGRSMTRGMFGADPDALRDLAGVIDRYSDDLANARALVSRLIEDVDWIGQDADQFRTRFDDECGPHMARLVNRLDDSRSDLMTQADEQDQTSSADGSALSMFQQAFTSMLGGALSAATLAGLGAAGGTLAALRPMDAGRGSVFGSGADSRGSRDARNQSFLAAAANALGIRGGANGMRRALIEAVRRFGPAGAVGLAGLALFGMLSKLAAGSKSPYRSRSSWSSIGTRSSFGSSYHSPYSSSSTPHHYSGGRPEGIARPSYSSPSTSGGSSSGGGGATAAPTLGPGMEPVPHTWTGPQVPSAGTVADTQAGTIGQGVAQTGYSGGGGAALSLAGAGRGIPNIPPGVVVAVAGGTAATGIAVTAGALAAKALRSRVNLGR